MNFRRETPDNNGLSAEKSIVRNPEDNKDNKSFLESLFKDESENDMHEADPGDFKDENDHPTRDKDGFFKGKEESSEIKAPDLPSIIIDEKFPIDIKSPINDVKDYLKSYFEEKTDGEESLENKASDLPDIIIDEGFPINDFLDNDLMDNLKSYFDDNTEESADNSDDSDSSGDNPDNSDSNESTDEQDPEKELTQDEINEKQKEAIKEGIKKLLNGELTNAEKGNLAEMMMDQYYISQGYTPLHDRVTSLDQKGHTGIDGIYEKEGPDGKKQYVIADAKYGQSPLGDTKDGTKQMSADWIDDRLEDSVGKEKADEIREAQKDERVETVVFHVDISVNNDGQSDEVKCETQFVDETGSKEPGKQEVQTYDADGNVKEEQS